ncbi:hypothetical protein N7508_007836 [Penicillium antarcticum]|uniref:uncharacterized protein n=1 Tax=Penicillium antarcticum TaxID=416450 RepID=UPI00238F9458|nr:uncharacterized protein N7508_007836 [Penicillium antarcticum]KAJ5297587.1 hypothetical protein N7508_007836 [Penicillium antarcticum]
MSNLRVLIVGASITGPTAAYWFAKMGAKITVIELFPQMRTSGQNINIRTTGVSVMRRMPGMKEAVRAKIVPMEGISIVRENGRPYGTMKATGNHDQQSLVSEYEILRGDLAHILFDLTKDHEAINYVFAEQIASMQQDEHRNGPVTIDFMNGTPSSQYVLVVACDGIGCGVRDYIHPARDTAPFVGGRTICIGPDATSGNRVTLIGMSPPSGHDSVLQFRKANKLGTEELKIFLARHYKGAGWKSDQVMQGMTEAEDFYASEMLLIKSANLYKGRFALVGDAGYATGPTGTATRLAMASAYMLAGEINKHRGNLAAELKGYEEQMRPLINGMQRIPPLVPMLIGTQTT